MVGLGVPGMSFPFEVRLTFSSFSTFWFLISDTCMSICQGSSLHVPYYQRTPENGTSLYKPYITFVFIVGL